jgi:small subunit ribosomal protein S20
MVRTYLKKVDAAIASGDKAVAQEAYTASVPVIDRMADKGIIHKNKAARHKSRLNAKVKALNAA